MLRTGYCLPQSRDLENITAKSNPKNDVLVGASRRYNLSPAESGIQMK